MARRSAAGGVSRRTSLRGVVRVTEPAADLGPHLEEDPALSSPQLIVSRTRVAGRPTVFARGELDLATAPDLGAAVRSALRGGDGATLDLTGLTFADSS